MFAAAIDGIHRALSALLSPLIEVLSGLSSLSIVIILSLLSGLLLVLLYGRVSFQNQIRVTKQGIHAALLEVILFRHSPLLSLAAQLRMLKGGFVYLILAVPPILVLALPCIFLMAQLQGWFGFEPISPGKTALLRVEFEKNVAANQISLRTDGAVHVTGPLRDEGGAEVLWRLEPSAPGKFPLEVAGPQGETVKLQLVSEPGLSKIESLVSASWLDKLLYPSRAGLGSAQGFFDRVEIVYPEQEYSLLGYHMHWIYIFLIFSLIGGFVGGKVFAIEL